MVVSAGAIIVFAGAAQVSTGQTQPEPARPIALMTLDHPTDVDLLGLRLIKHKRVRTRLKLQLPFANRRCISG